MLELDWLPSQIPSNISVYIGSSSDSFPDDIVSIPSSLINGARVDYSPDLLPLAASSQVSDDKPPSSNCANVILSPVSPLGDVAQGMYDISGRIDIASVDHFNM